jgi:hypothetical protein
LSQPTDNIYQVPQVEDLGGWTTLRDQLLELTEQQRLKFDAGTPIYDELKREFDEQQAFDENLRLLSGQKPTYGSFI